MSVACCILNEIVQMSRCKFGGSATVENILEFIDEGNDVVIAGSPSLGEATREVACFVIVDVNHKYL